MSSSEPKDSNFVVRWLHLHTLKYVFDLGRAKENSGTFPTHTAEDFPLPRFQMFRPLPRYYTHQDDRFKLFKNIYLAFRW